MLVLSTEIQRRAVSIEMPQSDANFLVYKISVRARFREGKRGELSMPSFSMTASVR